MDGNLARRQFLEEKRLEYLTSNVWYEDVWEEEVTVYNDQRYPWIEDIWKTFDDVKSPRIMLTSCN